MPKINIKAKTENNRKNIKKNFKNMNKDNTTNKFYSNSIYDKRKIHPQLRPLFINHTILGHFLAKSLITKTRVFLKNVRDNFKNPIKIYFKLVANKIDALHEWNFNTHKTFMEKFFFLLFYKNYNMLDFKLNSNTKNLMVFSSEFVLIINRRLKAMNYSSINIYKIFKDPWIKAIIRSYIIPCLWNFTLRDFIRLIINLCDKNKWFSTFGYPWLINYLDALQNDLSTWKILAFAYNGLRIYLVGLILHQKIFSYLITQMKYKQLKIDTDRIWELVGRIFFPIRRYKHVISIKNFNYSVRVYKSKKINIVCRTSPNGSGKATFRNITKKGKVFYIEYKLPYFLYMLANLIQLDNIESDKIFIHPRTNLFNTRFCA